MKSLTLNRIEVFHFWQVAMYQQHGYHIKVIRGRTFMQRTIH